MGDGRVGYRLGGGGFVDSGGQDEGFWVGVFWLLRG